MKTMIARASLWMLIAIMGVLPAHAQRDKQAVTKQLVESGRYVFIPQSALPLSGRIRQLTPDYNLLITKDTLDTYLPYFGRAYSAPVNITDGGIRFVSTSFEYTATPRKKSGWDISIKPKDYKEVQQMQLSVSESGYASLQVISTNRQPISFNGYITEVKGKRK